jgi:O-glycosyl hydrolase
MTSGMRLPSHRKKKISPFLSTMLLVAGLITVNVGNAAIAQASTEVTVNPSQAYQTIEGWGTTLAWWANIIGGWSTSQKTALAEALFNPTSGIGINVLRYNFGADGPGNTCESQMQPGGNIPSFEPTDGNYVWTNDANQLWFAQEAKSLGVSTFEGFANSAPAWMLENSCTAGGPGGADNLNPSYNSDFASYLATIDAHFHNSFGITMQTIDAFNEPNQPYWTSTGDQEGMAVSTAQQNTIIPLLKAALQSNGASAYTSISAPDDTSVSSSISAYNGYSSATQADISQWNTHTYSATPAQEQSAYSTIGQTGGKRLWMSEWNDGANGNEGSEINAAMVLSDHILTDEQNLHPSAWVIWQAVNQVGESIDGDQGLAYVSPSDVISYLPRYYAMGNYSKFVTPGYQMIGNSDAGSFTAYDSATKSLVIVTTNDTSSAVPYDYNLSDFGSVGATATPYQTSATENLAQLSNLGISNKTLTASLPADSITTFVIPNTTVSGSGSGPVAQELVGSQSGKCLDVPGATTTVGTQLDIYTCNGGTNQQYTENSNGTITVYGNRCLEAYAGASTPGTIVDIYTCNGGTNQQWTVNSNGTITNNRSGLCLDVANQATANDSDVDLWTCNGGANQKWTATTG